MVRFLDEDFQLPIEILYWCLSLFFPIFLNLSYDKDRISHIFFTLNMTSVFTISFSDRVHIYA